MNKDDLNKGKPSGEKIHSMFGEPQNTKDDLRYDSTNNSYELDKESEDPDYDHPLPYDTSAEDGTDNNSNYDEANPYVGNEYKKNDKDDLEKLEDLSMRIDSKGSILKLSKEDELLSRTEEDERDDLDDEGYPKNNKKF